MISNLDITCPTCRGVITNDIIERFQPVIRIEEIRAEAVRTEAVQMNEQIYEERDTDRRVFQVIRTEDNQSRETIRIRELMSLEHDTGYHPHPDYELFRRFGVLEV
jgi:hypothetical protein